MGLLEKEKLNPKGVFMSRQLAYIGPAEPQHAISNRTYQGIPGIAVSPKGRIFTLCYTGGSWEGPGNYVAVWFSDDGGKTWSDTVTVIVPPQADIRAYDSTPWIAPDGRLFIFWTQCVTKKVGQIFDGRAGVWFSWIQDPDGDPKDFHWSEPVRIADGIMMNKPVVLSEGTWALPISVWGFTDSVQIAADPANAGTKLYASEDSGKTFYERGRFLIPEELRTFDEHSFVELKNGDIFCIARTKTGNYQALSSDGGRSWHDGQVSPVIGPCSRLFITRLKSRRLLLVNNTVDPEHPKKRQKMTAFLSDDDGQTWFGSLLLDERDEVSYPDGQQVDDGSIWIVHDWNRRNGCEIVVSHFTEDDVIAGHIVSPNSKLKIIAARSRPVE